MGLLRTTGSAANAGPLTRRQLHPSHQKKLAQIHLGLVVGVGCRPPVTQR